MNCLPSRDNCWMTSFLRLTNGSCYLASLEPRLACSRHSLCRQQRSNTRERNAHDLTRYIEDTTDPPVFLSGNIISKTILLFAPSTLLFVCIWYNFSVYEKLVMSIYASVKKNLWEQCMLVVLFVFFVILFRPWRWYFIIMPIMGKWRLEIHSLPSITKLGLQT